MAEPPQKRHCAAVPCVEDAAGAIGRACTVADVERAVAELASTLLSTCEIAVNSRRFHLVSVEAYVHSECHPDTHAHRDARQLKSGIWYFHRAGKGYKGGTYKGVDIAFGSPPNVYAGMLVRAIKDTETGAVISGPCLVCNTVMGPETKVADFVASNWAEEEAPYLNEAAAFRLVQLPSPHTHHLRVCRTGRVGLTLKRAEAFGHSHRAFFAASYRFCTDLTLAKARDYAITALLLDDALPVEAVSAATKAALSSVRARYAAIQRFTQAKASKRRKPGQLPAAAFKGAELCYALAVLQQDWLSLLEAERSNSS